MDWLEGQVALVTGGASGIGRAVTRRYVQEGARVCVVDVDEEKLGLIADELGDSVTTFVCDVRAIEQNQAAVAHAEATFGKLDIFVANAGLSDMFTDLADIPADRVAAVYDEIFDV